ncbi:tetratricopeptide repeat protein [Phenylobacterium sp. J367]|uniref:tetratricopeptide repeat protein n=1 Tax=Phenylobacterium sp. J367 TaxID=2898435 RepID=UPI002151DDA9|nr:tetratricopeptide repeat protein [Phenylobacterium sp. J367]MCR5878498.1 tetratricopeptide repeat protein [Phenylobacterium sp. J367]
MRRILVLVGIASLATLAATSAGAQAVTVLGGSQARLCAYAAQTGEDDIASQAVCTNALTTEVLDPLDRAGTFVNRGVMKLRRKDFAGATADFDAALQVKPDLGEAYLNRGAATLGARRFAASIADLDRALALGVKEPEKAHFNRALAHENLGQWEAALADYARAIELRPEWQQPRTELARLSVAPP